MPSSRRKSSGKIVVIWVVLFVLGLFTVFLFFNGKWVIKNGSLITEHSGYVEFSSPRASFFVGENFLGIDTGSIQLPLEKYDFCFSRFYYHSRCFFGKKVKDNAFARTDLKNIFLRKSLQFPRKITDARVYWHPEGRGLFWYDMQRKMVFFIERGKEDIQGRYMTSIVENAQWNEINETFTVTSPSGEKDELDLFPSSFFSSLPSISPAIRHEYGGQNIFVQHDKIEKKIIASFSEPFDRILPLPNSDAVLLIFPSSVYIWYEADNQVKKIIQKDEGSDVLFLSKKKEIFWKQDGALWKREL